MSLLPGSGSAGTGKASGSASRGRTTPHSQALTALAASPPGDSLPWCCGVAQLLLVHRSGGLAEHWCRFFCMMGRAFTPALCHPLLHCCSPGPFPHLALHPLQQQPSLPGHWALTSASAPCMTCCHPQLDPRISPAQCPGQGAAVLGMVMPCAMCPGLIHGPAQLRLSCDMGEAGSLPSPSRVCLYPAPSSPCPLCPMTCPNAGRVPSGAAP